MLSGLFHSPRQSRPAKARAVSVAAGVGLSVCLLLGGLVSTGLAASPTIDGHFSAGDGYTNGYQALFVTTQRRGYGVADWGTD